MPMSAALRQAYNDQIALEFASSFAYLAMAAYLEDANLDGMAHWMKVQYQEETEHAHKFFSFLLDRGERPHLAALPEPGADFASVEAVFAKALEHEQKVTAAINHLYGLASADKDYASLPLLQWFVTEQVEEEANVTRILERLKMTAGHAAALLVLDRELGARKGD